MGYSDNKKSLFPHTALEKAIFQQIETADSRAISFAEFMGLALYHPAHGYYSKPWERAIGRGGDFFTSVSVGDTFGFLIAQAIEHEWRENFDSAENFTIIEQGAHDGQLAIDIVTALAAQCPDFFDKGGSYTIVEPREDIRHWLRARFQKIASGGGAKRPAEPDSPSPKQQGTFSEAIGYVHRINPVASFSEARSETGVVLANELLDAFPVHRVHFENGAWRELHVTEHNDGFAWQPTDIAPDSALQTEISRLGTDFTEGYTTEICLEIGNWVSEVTSAFSKRGRVWVFDYGFEDDDYFASHRTTGTLQCYRNHEKSENPFEEIGETDLTTHVNFSHLAREAEKHGLTDFALTDQHHFLIHAAEPWLRKIDGVLPDAKTAQQIRQFQTLTHPALMGQSFKVATFQTAHGISE